MKFPLSMLKESKQNNRKTFAIGPLKELAASIREVGLVQPIIVRHSGKKYEIIAGARRFRAAKLAGLKKIDVIVRSAKDDTKAFILQLVENVQREDLNPVEEAAGYAMLRKRTKKDVAAIAKMVGKSKGYVYSRLQLGKLEPAVKAKIKEGTLSAEHGILLARCTPTEQKDLVWKIVRSVWANQGNSIVTMSVKETQKLIARRTKIRKERQARDRKIRERNRKEREKAARKKSPQKKTAAPAKLSAKDEKAARAKKAAEDAAAQKIHGAICRTLIIAIGDGARKGSKARLEKVIVEGLTQAIMWGDCVDVPFMFLQGTDLHALKPSSRKKAVEIAVARGFAKKDRTPLLIDFLVADAIGYRDDNIAQLHEVAKRFGVNSKAIEKQTRKVLEKTGKLQTSAKPKKKIKVVPRKKKRK